MSNNIHFESEHKVYIAEELAGILSWEDPSDGKGGRYMYYPDNVIITNYDADELRVIASKLDELNSADKLDGSEEPDPGWIVWEGGVCPTAYSVNVEVMFREGKKKINEAGNFDWGHCKDGGDIVAYRVIYDLSPVYERQFKTNKED